MNQGQQFTSEDPAIYRLSARLGAILTENALRATVAESCTGGWIGQALTQVPGSSHYFHTGYVVYGNESKSRVLGVPKPTLRKFGAVSGEVVTALTDGLLVNETNADLAIAVSGVAGPGGTKIHPAGMVYMAWQLRGKEVMAQRYDFRGNRSQVRRRTVATALAVGYRMVQRSLSK